MNEPGPVPNLAELALAHKLYLEREPRDLNYRVAEFLVASSPSGTTRFARRTAWVGPIGLSIQLVTGGSCQSRRSKCSLSEARRQSDETR